MVLLFFATRPDKFHDEQRLGVVTSGLYWNFVVASWIPIYALLYLAPRLV